MNSYLFYNIYIYVCVCTHYNARRELGYSSFPGQHRRIIMALTGPNNKIQLRHPNSDCLMVSRPEKDLVLPTIMPIHIWGFPKMEIPTNHPNYRPFQYRNSCFWGSPVFKKPIFIVCFCGFSNPRREQIIQKHPSD